MVNLTFNAIDVETANRNRASICQIGIAQVRTGKIHKTLSILVNPEEPFESINTGIHGIEVDSVRDADTFPGIYSRLHKLIEGTTLVSHTSFDRQALEKAMSKYGLPSLQVRWLDSSQIARSAWPEKYERGGWSLQKISADLGITFQHHDAEQDARAAAEIVLHAHRHTGLDVDDWVERSEYARSTTNRTTVKNTDQPNSRSETPSAPPSSPTPTWVRLLTSILTLEEMLGFNNTSVVGGMDSFIQTWAQTIAEDMGDSGVHRVLSTIPYTDLTPEERYWWAEQWHALISQRQHAELDPPEAPARSKPPASSNARLRSMEVQSVVGTSETLPMPPMATPHARETAPENQSQPARPAYRKPPGD